MCDGPQQKRQSDNHAMGKPAADLLGLELDNKGSKSQLETSCVETDPFWMQSYPAALGLSLDRGMESLALGHCSLLGCLEIYLLKVLVQACVTFTASNSSWAFGAALLRLCCWLASLHFSLNFHRPCLLHGRFLLQSSSFHNRPRLFEHSQAPVTTAAIAVPSISRYAENSHANRRVHPPSLQSSAEQIFWGLQQQIVFFLQLF